MKSVALAAMLFICCSSWADQNKKGDFFIIGFETSEVQKPASESSTQSYPVYEMIYPGDWSTATMMGTAGNKNKPRTVKAAPITAEENTDALRKTLDSFQKAITGLCISHLELSLAFNVSAKAWMIVTGEVAGSIKVILKNPDEKCPKAGS